MLVGGPPFESSDLLETINRIKAVLYKMPNLLSAKAQHLIMSVMRLSPSDRLTLHGLCCILYCCHSSCVCIIQLNAVIVMTIQCHTRTVAGSISPFRALTSHGRSEHALLRVFVI